MKRIELSKANAPLSMYAKGAKEETLVITVRGRPIAAVVSLAGVDAESLAVSTNPTFIGIIERSRRRHQQEGGIRSADVRRMLGLDAAPTMRERVPRTKRAPRTKLARKGVAKTRPTR